MVTEGIVRLSIFILCCVLFAYAIYRIVVALDHHLIKKNLAYARALLAQANPPQPEPVTDAWDLISHADVKLFLSQSTWEAIEASLKAKTPLLEGSAPALPDTVVPRRRACQECTSRCTPCK